MVQIYAPTRRRIKGAKLTKEYRHKTIIAFSPHSDDLSISAGGLIAKLSRHNKIVPVLAFTGWRGVDAKTPREKAVAIREGEMKREARALGMSSPIFLRLESYEKKGAKCYRMDREKISDIISQHKPDVILLPSKHDVQPRHSLLTRFILKSLTGTNKKIDAIYYETPWSLFSAAQINFIVPLTKAMRAKKTKGIKVHNSQMKRNNFVKISRAMMEYRALALPEQIIGGYGSSLELGSWVEAYNIEKINDCNANKNR